MTEVMVGGVGGTVAAIANIDVVVGMFPVVILVVTVCIIVVMAMATDGYSYGVKYGHRKRLWVW